MPLQLPGLEEKSGFTQVMEQEEGWRVGLTTPVGAHVVTGRRGGADRKGRNDWQLSREPYVAELQSRERQERGLGDDMILIWGGGDLAGLWTPWGRQSRWHMGR